MRFAERLPVLGVQANGDGHALVPAGTLRAGAVLCIGRSYAKHAAELNNPVPTEPVIFQKGPASLRALDATGELAFPDEAVHHEAEVVLVIGADLALGGQGDWSHVSHLALGLDLTRRELQNALKASGMPWDRAKSFYGAAPISPLVPLAWFGDRAELGHSLSVNGELRQRGRLSELLWTVPALLTELAKLQPLALGDLIFTGTPEGVAPIRKGERFTLRFEPSGLAFEGQL